MIKTGVTILCKILDIEPSILRQIYVEKPYIQIYFIIPSCQAVTL
jgi:glycosylphosphatidylinositol transamidase (GPIT) subunit GPI8